MNNITEIKINGVEQNGKPQSISATVGTTLTEDDLSFVKAIINEVFAQLQNKVGKPKEEARTNISGQGLFLDQSLFQNCIC